MIKSSIMKKLLMVFITIQLLSFGKSIAQPNQTIDKIVAIVGQNAILYSDIENQYMQYLMQGYTSDREAIRCQIFEELLFAKLLLNKAELDSITVSDEQVETEMDRRLQYFISQIGSQEKLEEYYSKSILEIKNDLKTIIRDQMLSEQVQRSIIEGVKITPTEVRNYFKEIPKDSLPTIESEISYSELVIIPKVNAEERAYAKQRIEELRTRIIKGEDFAALARIYSEDPGSALKGGELGDFSRGVMYPEFEAAAFALQGDEISQVIETEAGFHILKLIKRKGDYINVRHILIMTKVSPYSLNHTKNYLDSILNLIESGKLTFNEAVEKFSEVDSKFNNGAAINQASGNANFKPSDLDKNFYYTLEKMNVGEISKSIQFQHEKTKNAYHIIRLDKKTKPHIADLQTDYDRIQEAALEQKKAKMIEDWIKKRISQTYINISDEELKQCTFQHKWL